MPANKRQNQFSRRNMNDEKHSNLFFRRKSTKSVTNFVKTIFHVEIDLRLTIENHTKNAVTFDFPNFSEWGQKYYYGARIVI
jgi:hypothetical protein